MHVHFEFAFFKRIQWNEINSRYSKKSQKYTKFEHVVAGTVVGLKNSDAKRKKLKTLASAELDTQQRNYLKKAKKIFGECRGWHSAKKVFAREWALGKEIIQKNETNYKCPTVGTRQRLMVGDHCHLRLSLLRIGLCRVSWLLPSAPSTRQSILCRAYFFA